MFLDANKSFKDRKCFSLELIVYAQICVVSNIIQKKMPTGNRR